MPHVNLSNVDDANLIPGGEYQVRLVDFEHKTKNSKEMTQCKFEILKGDLAGKYLFDFFSYSEKALFRLKIFAKAVNYEKRKDPDGFNSDELFELALRTPVLVNVYINEYEGRKNNRIDTYEPISDAVEESNANDPFGDDVPI